MSKVKTKEADKENESTSYQQMLEEVEGIVRSVGGGPLDLDEVVTRVERGYKLIKVMRERLDATKAKVEKLRTDFESDGSPTETEAPKKAQKHSKQPKTEETAKPADEQDDDEDTPF